MVLSLLGLLIANYLYLEVNRRSVSSSERWCVDIPFNVYLGWISVTTVANITDWLYQIQWSRWALFPQVWAVMMLVTASLIGSAMTITRQDAAYLFVMVWSFAGIGIKQAATPLVAVSAWVAALFALALAVYCLFNRRLKPVHE